MKNKKIRAVALMFAIALVILTGGLIIGAGESPAGVTETYDTERFPANTSYAGLDVSDPGMSGFPQVTCRMSARKAAYGE